MAIDDVLLDVLTESDDDLYEDDYMKVVKIIKEIQTGSKDYVKRLQLVIWKKKNTELPDFDIRGFSYKTNRYQKGLTLNHFEMEELYQSLKDYFESKN